MSDIELIKDFTLDYFRLDGKVAIVTGANKGLGMGNAVALAKAGADIICPTAAAILKRSRLSSRPRDAALNSFRAT